MLVSCRRFILNVTKGILFKCRSKRHCLKLELNTNLSRKGNKMRTRCWHRPEIESCLMSKRLRGEQLTIDSTRLWLFKFRLPDEICSGPAYRLWVFCQQVWRSRRVSECLKCRGMHDCTRIMQSHDLVRDRTPQALFAIYFVIAIICCQLIPCLAAPIIATPIIQ